MNKKRVYCRAPTEKITYYTSTIKFGKAFLLSTALTALTLSNAYAADQIINSVANTINNISNPDSIIATTDTTTSASAFSITGSVGFNVGQPLTLNGVISGNGNIIKTGTDTLTLGGVNTFTGYTQVDAGTVSFDNNNRLGNAANTVILNGGTLKITSAITVARDMTLNANSSIIDTSGITATISGNIGGSGGLFQTGGGRLILSGNNTYTGGTEITQSYLDTFSDASLGNPSGALTIGNGMFMRSRASYTFSRQLIIKSGGVFINTFGFDMIISGAISDHASGGGTFCKTGAGTLTLSGYNTFTGDTRVAQDTVFAGNANSLSPFSRLLMDNVGGANVDISAGNQTIAGLISGGNLGGNIILGNSTLTITGTDNIYNGAITGNGNLIIASPNGQTLGGTNTYTGATTVNGGTLAIDGSIARGATVNSGGRLTGTGTIGSGGNYDVVNNGGTVAPGSSLTSAYGTLTVTGNYSGTGTLNIALKAAASPVTTDVADLAVTGTADISQTALTLNPAAGTYTPDASYTILNAGAVLGKFTNDGSLAYINDVYKPKITYGATSVKIKLIADRVNPAASTAAASSPQAPVFNYIASLPKTEGSDLTNVLSGLVLLPVSEQIVAVKAISPDRNGTVTAVSMDTSTSTITGGRMTAMRGACVGGTSAPAALNGSAKATTALTQMLGMKSFDAIKGLSNTLGAFQADVKDSMDQQAQATHGQGGIWLHTFGNYSTQQDVASSNGFRGKSAGAMVGLDKKLTDHLIAGVGVGFTQSLISLNKNGGNSRVRSYSLTTYGTWFDCDLHLDASATASFNRYTLSRTIQFTGVNRIAGSRHDGYVLTPHLGMGYDVHLPYNITLEPFAGVDYVMQREKAYTESGAGDLNNAIKGKVSTLLRTEVGTNISHTIKMEEGAKLSLSAKASYIRKSSRNDQKMTASFAGQNQAFMIEGSSKVRQQMAAGVEATLTMANSLYLMTRYSGEYDRRYKAHEVVVKVGKRF